LTFTQPQFRPATLGADRVIETKTGKVLVKLRPGLAPKHVERVKQLAKEIGAGAAHPSRQAGSPRECSDPNAPET
jgi:hypothetical protein